MRIEDYFKVVQIYQINFSNKIYLDVHRGNILCLAKDYKEVNGKMKCIWERVLFQEKQQ